MKICHRKALDAELGELRHFYTICHGDVLFRHVSATTMVCRETDYNGRLIHWVSQQYHLQLKQSLQRVSVFSRVKLPLQPLFEHKV
jgi:hypothetical protein